MPRQWIEISPLQDVSVDSVNRLIMQLNEGMLTISRALAAIEGWGEAGGSKLTPTFRNDVDVLGNKVVNVEAATASTDAVQLSQVTTPENIDHAVLLNLLAPNDHHTQYFHVDGRRAIAGPLKHTGSTAGFYGTAAVARPAALANPTDGTGGTVGNVPAIPDPADAPASADALRDDLVANTLPKIRDGIASTLTAANKALTVLRTLGLMAP